MGLVVSLESETGGLTKKLPMVKALSPARGDGNYGTFAVRMS